MRIGLLISLLFPLFVSAQIVNIPDANFKAALVGNSFINTNLDSEIQVSEASAFSDSIDVSSLGISDLTGIEAFVNITLLNCFNNSLTSLDVSNNTALTYLNCCCNSLTSLDVSSNTKLTYLRCSGNSLTSLDLSNNTALVELNCDYNPFTTLDLSNNVALETLDCSGLYFLTDLNISNNTLLMSLSVGYNTSLLTLDLSNNTALTSLWASESSFSYIDLRNGNNINMTIFVGAICIAVDDSAWSYANWPSPGGIFSNDCMLVGINDIEFNQASIISFGNTITIKGKGTATIYNLQGQRVHHSKLTGNTSISLDRGIYLVRVMDNGSSVTKKVYLH